MPRLSNPLVTVVMPVYNTGKFLIRSIQSILNQTYSNLELIVIDDASVDGSEQIIKRFARDRRVKIIVHKKNVGISQSLNEGISAARGRFIARMDSDDISFPSRIECQVKHLLKDSEVKLIGTGAIIIDEEGQQLLRLVNPSSDKEIRDAISWRFCFVSGSLAFDKEALQTIGSFDSNVPGCEDLELVLRFLSKYKVTNLPDALYYWRKTIAGESNTNRKDLVERSVLAREVFKAKKNGDTAHLELIYNKFRNHYLRSTKKPKLQNMKSLEYNYYFSLVLGGLRYGLSKEVLRPYLTKLNRLMPITQRALITFGIHIPSAIRILLSKVFAKSTGRDKGIGRIES